ncbi:trichohyalin-like [Ixodes scapularis]|uniref:trichohyalin-like n=1 Tax=Ixodes scapularis TaxID=6945 RepID=UPI001C386776|nr:trichohyalin-like [Ixodes scapularis]
MLQAEENLAARMHDNLQHIEVGHSQNQERIKEQEWEVALLKQERDDLSVLLATGNNANKKSQQTRILEQRRKRIKELDERVAKLRKKVLQEQATMIGPKEEERDVRKLKEEILEMKKTRVRLMRQLKKESEQHRRAQREHDREVSTLRLREHQRVAQAARQERQSGLKISALQRSMEDALVDKSRLEAALQRQQIDAGKTDPLGEMCANDRSSCGLNRQARNANTTPLLKVQSKLLEAEAKLREVQEHKEREIKGLELQLLVTKKEHRDRMLCLLKHFTSTSWMLQAEENLAARMHDNLQHIEVGHSQNQERIKEQEWEVALLKQERDDLSVLLATGNNANKKSQQTRILEQRRKRIKELDERVAKLRKKVLQEQATMIGPKEEERDVRKLKEEILEMKKTRVRLMRQLKKESEQHRRAQREHDRECANDRSSCGLNRQARNANTTPLLKVQSKLLEAEAKLREVQEHKEREIKGLELQLLVTKKEHRDRMLCLLKHFTSTSWMLQAEENLAARMHDNLQHIEVGHSQNQERIKEQEWEVALLKQERDDLSVLLATGNNANKKSQQTRILEQRRKRIKELDERVAKLRKKVQEQATMIGPKEEERDVRKLKEEILEMKKTRVRLMRQLKKESEQHRRAQREHDREVSTLRLREHQRVAQAARQERQSGLKISALQRSMEDALVDKSRLECANDRSSCGLNRQARNANTTPLLKVQSKLLEAVAKLREVQEHKEREIKGLELQLLVTKKEHRDRMLCLLKHFTSTSWPDEQQGLRVGDATLPQVIAAKDAAGTAHAASKLSPGPSPSVATSSVGVEVSSTACSVTTNNTPKGNEDMDETTDSIKWGLEEADPTTGMTPNPNPWVGVGKRVRHKAEHNVPPDDRRPHDSK